MTVEHVEFLVEELSMEIFLRGILPRVLGDVSFDVYPSQCKEDLLERLPERLQGYAGWLPDSWRLVIMVDRDYDDCRDLKRRLENMAGEAGLLTRTEAVDQPYSIVNRIVIEELEAWYFGDWEAVRQAYPRVPRTVPMQAKYRDPDSILGGTWEAFERVLKRAGYFDGGLRKIEAAKMISRYSEPSRNRSRSFSVFHSALVEMAM